MLDKTDRGILEILGPDARISHSEIAKRIGMTPPGVLDRIRKLEKKGIIEGYETRVSSKKLGLCLTSFVLVNSDEAIGTIKAGVAVSKLPEVQEVHCMAGDFWYMLKVRVEDSDAHMRFIKKLGAVKGIRDCRSIMVLNTIKETIALNVDRK